MVVEPQEKKHIYHHIYIYIYIYIYAHLAPNMGNSTERKRRGEDLQIFESTNPPKLLQDDICNMYCAWASFWEANMFTKGDIHLHLKVFKPHSKLLVSKRMCQSTCKVRQHMHGRVSKSAEASF